MPRSSWKIPAIKNCLLRRAQSEKDLQKKQIIKTWARSSVIVPSFVGLTFAIHNGRKFVNLMIEAQMVGHKLGEFSPTRTFYSHSGDKKISKSN